MDFTYSLVRLCRNTGEWDKLAKWVIKNELFSDNVRWLIQIPRLYDVFKKSGGVKDFEEVVRSALPTCLPVLQRRADLFLLGIADIFQPLFEVTADPTSHPELHILLQRVVGFDSVDDESKAERRIYRKFPVPKDWNTTQNRRSLPPGLDPLMLIVDALDPFDSAVRLLVVLPVREHDVAQQLATRARLQYVSLLQTLSSSFLLADEPTPSDTFWLRPHAGEAGDTDHLTSAFLTSHSISHGILLRKVPALQYLFYLKQIGVKIS
jgi:AMP deaminase